MNRIITRENIMMKFEKLFEEIMNDNKIDQIKDYIVNYINDEDIQVNYEYTD